nr:ureidoglycolate lyase [Rubidibacter lacunae]
MPATRTLSAVPGTIEVFAPFGQLVGPTPDGKPFDADDAQLDLSQGTPRLYIMRLQFRGRRFHRITRHQRCTQCLGTVSGQPWFLAVAPPSRAPEPDPDTIAVFRMEGPCFLKLAVGTWHAGPYFDADQLDFYNLELSDTNLIDRQTHDFRSSHGFEFAIA